MYWISLDATLKLPLIFRVTGYPISLFDLRFLWVPGVYFVSILATVFFFFPPFFFCQPPANPASGRKGKKKRKNRHPETRGKREKEKKNRHPERQRKRENCHPARREKGGKKKEKRLSYCGVFFLHGQAQEGARCRSAKKFA